MAEVEQGYMVTLEEGDQCYYEKGDYEYNFTIQEDGQVKFQVNLKESKHIIYCKTYNPRKNEFS